MPTQDTTQMKEKIIATIRRRAPSLPVHIAKETGLSILFASAFLSELLSEKKIKMSYLRVGSSPVYFIPGQEYSLERFSQYLNNKEKEAFEFLKEKKFLKDIEQNPAIRVALREIKDFSIPLEKEGKLYWRYYSVPESEFTETRAQKKDLEEAPQIEEKIQRIEQNLQKTSEAKLLDIFEKPEASKTKKITLSKKKKNIPKKQDGKFFNKVKGYLSKNSIEMIDIEEFSKNQIILKIKRNKEEGLLIAYNKKRLTETDLINSNKKAEERGLTYSILSLGEPLKKLDNLINAIRNLKEINRLE